jgi:hypothetical protein
VRVKVRVGMVYNCWSLRFVVDTWMVIVRWFLLRILCGGLRKGEMPDRERLLRVVICFPRVDITSGESE